MTKQEADAKREQWVAGKQDVEVKVGEDTMKLEPRQFKTGSVGYFFSGKVKIGGERFQVTSSFTLIGSKDWDKKE
jgi:hypothetical protein